MRRLPFAVCEIIDVGSIKLSFQFCVGGWINLCAYSALGRFGVCMSFCQVTLQTFTLVCDILAQGTKMS